MIENIFPPIPSEVILAFSGMLCVTTSLSYMGVVAVATLGAYMGALILYGIGWSMTSYYRLERLCRKDWVSGLGFQYRNIETARDWFEKHGVKTIFLCRLLPLIRSLISIPAGIIKMPILTFSLWTLIGTALWNSILVYIGMLLGKNWPTISQYCMKYVFVIFIIGSIYYIIKKIWVKQKSM